mmetsp:Transcript_126658/g.270216  ORF Transcript_126658/g.270216 Transcript_126658/m.270216 type:complete len:276 (-) Transcript_126658:116-943(-)
MASSARSGWIALHCRGFSWTNLACILLAVKTVTATAEQELQRVTIDHHAEMESLKPVEPHRVSHVRREHSVVPVSGEAIEMEGIQAPSVVSSARVHPMGLNESWAEAAKIERLASQTLQEANTSALPVHATTEKESAEEAAKIEKLASQAVLQAAPALLPVHATTQTESLQEVEKFVRLEDQAAREAGLYPPPSTLAPKAEEKEAESWGGLLIVGITVLALCVVGVAIKVYCEMKAKDSRRSAERRSQAPEARKQSPSNSARPSEVGSGDNLLPG